MELVVQNRENAKTGWIIILYPVIVLLIAALLNQFVFGVTPIVVALPLPETLTSLIAAVTLLVLNHVYLMTATELTRMRFNLHATPEEWAQSNSTPQEASPEGVQELERHHNAHRNATENTVYFALLAALFVLTSPAIVPATIWCIGFALGRLGHSVSYLTGRDTLRGVFMTVSLLALFGMLSHLVLAAFA